MVVRRIREHVATHNWFAVAVDLAIVVAGVFLGTQVSNWNADRIDADRADQLRARLIDELDFNARQYALQHAYYRQAKAYGLQALADVAGRARLNDRDFLIAAYQLTQVDTTRTKTGVFDELADNGLVDRLGDEETQQIASDFYLTAEVTQRGIEAIFPYRTLLRETMPYAVQTRIRDDCGDRDIYFKQRLVGITTVIPCPVIIEPAEAARVANIIRATPNLEREMTRYVASLDEKLDNLSLAVRQAKQFRNRLIAASGPRSA